MNATMKSLRIQILYSLFILAFGLNICNSGFGQEKNNETTDSQYPKKLKAHSTWETILSFPGTVIYFPFKIVFKATEKTIAVVDETKIVQRVNDVLESDDGIRTLQPTYGARIGGGFNYIHRGLFTSDSKLTLTATAWVRNRQFYQANFENLRFAKWETGLRTTYHFLSDESFFGVGSNSSRNDESTYAREFIYAGTKLTRILGENTTVSLSAGFESNSILNGYSDDLKNTAELFSEETLAGIGTTSKLGHFQFSAFWDSKNRKGNPTSGHELSLTTGVFGEFQDRQFGFSLASIDFTQYVHLFYQRLLVFRIAGGVRRPFQGNEIPFYYLNELGERETIRGFRRGRFRDRDVFLTCLEYRYPLQTDRYKNSGIEALLFADAGQVYHDIFDDMSSLPFNFGAGGGIRFYNEDGTVAKIEISKSKDGLRFYFVLNE